MEKGIDEKLKPNSFALAGWKAAIDVTAGPDVLPTPEDVEAHLEQILSLEGMTIPSTARDDLAALVAHLPPQS